MAGTPPPGTEGTGPAPDCGLCPRLTRFRAENRAAEPGWYNAPVPSFGPLSARLLVVGLAPGRRGANATGRPFTGDFAGELLYPTLIEHGFARGPYRARADDGLELVDARITNAVRCVPPANRPTGPEIRTCRRFLEAEIAAMPGLACVVSLGAVAHGSLLRVLGMRPKDAPFRHGASYSGPDGIRIATSYHCSRLNTNTGRLTPAMFGRVFARARAILDGTPPAVQR